MRNFEKVTAVFVLEVSCRLCMKTQSASLTKWNAFYTVSDLENSEIKVKVSKNWKILTAAENK